MNMVTLFNIKYKSPFIGWATAKFCLGCCPTPWKPICVAEEALQRYGQPEIFNTD